jgi:Protease inhibitor Inh
MQQNAAITFPGAGRLATALLTAALVGCSGDRLGVGNSPDQPPPATAARAAGPRAVALADMAGRWQLAPPGSSGCGMTFTGVPGAVEGTIAPEGGCPGNLFTSRRWAFDQDALLIRSHTGETLARLAMPAPGRFEGKATTGETLALTR